MSFRCRPWVLAETRARAGVTCACSRGERRATVLRCGLLLAVPLLRGLVRDHGGGDEHPPGDDREDRHQEAEDQRSDDRGSKRAVKISHPTLHNATWDPRNPLA